MSLAARAIKSEIFCSCGKITDIYHPDCIINMTQLLKPLFISCLLASFLAVSACDNQHKLQSELQKFNAVKFSQAINVSDFNFTDEDSQTVTKQTLQGKWSLLFFGYTFCPDVCPTTLYTLKQAWKKLPKDVVDKSQVVMISVDPERDTEEVLKPYIEYFHPDYKGFTGNQSSLEKLASELNAIYDRVERDDQLGYLMDHSANIVILNPQGNYAGFIKPPFSADQIAQAVQLMQGKK